MSLGLLLLIVGILIAVIFSAFIIIYWEDVKDIFRIRNHRRKNERLLIDYYRRPTLFTRRWGHYRRMNWTDLNEETIRSLGYLKAEKWMDHIRYVGVPIYVRLHEFKKPPEPNKIQSSTLFNVFVSRSVKNFIQGIMTKVGFSPMDMKTLAILIPVAIGIAIGMWYFLSGGLK